MSSVRLAFTSSRGLAARATENCRGTARGLRPLSRLSPGTRGVVARVERDDTERTDRLLALGVTPGAAVVVLQTFPGVVFLCDQTELAVERAVAGAILIRPAER